MLRFLFYVLLAAGGASGSACAAAPDIAAGKAGSRRVILVGLDGADWSAIRPLARAGKLPSFSRVLSSGRTGVLLATPPLVSPILWTTIGTGRSPEDHGILDFMVDLPTGGQAPVTSAHRQVPALWNLFSDAGRSVAVIGWWATWPPENVKGTVVSDRVAPQLAGAGAGLDAQTVFPAQAVAALAGKVVRPSELTYEDLRRYVPLTRDEQGAIRTSGSVSVERLYEDPLAHLAIVAASTRSYTDMAEAIIAKDQPDLLLLYLEGIDTLSHLFVKDPRRGPSAIEAAYRDADDTIARLAQRSAPDTLIVICSDHGFYGPEASTFVKEDPALLAGPATAWHRPYGIVAAIEAGTLTGRSASTGPASAGIVTPLDIAPTLLHAAGLPLAAEMSGSVVMTLLPADATSRAVERRSTPRITVQRPQGAPGTADDALVARLRSLGYVGAQPSSLARQNLGEVLYRQRKLPAAERELRAVVEAQPSNLAAHLWLAKALAEQGRSREAVKVYEKAVRLPGGAHEALVEAVSLAIASGLKQEAAAIMAGVKTASAEAHVARAELAKADGRSADAQREMRQALTLDPLSFDALSRLLDISIDQGRPRSAIPALQRAAQRASGSPRHMALLGVALLAGGDGAGAEAALQQALELAPDASSVRIDLARARMAQRKWKEAQAALEPASPSMERSVLLGVSCSSLGRFGDASTHFEDAMKLNGGKATPDLLNGLGWARHKLGREAQAAAALRQSLALKRDQPEIRRLLAQIEGAPPAK